MMVNKEYGSDFHYHQPDYDVESVTESADKLKSAYLYFSGRVAIYSLLSFGIKKYGWRRVGFPSYYCHEVVDFCQQLPVEITYYKYNPLDDGSISEWEDKKDSVLICVDFFGCRKPDVTFLKHTVVIDDITHNLLSINESQADYCFGSLRKQLPIATGGFCHAKKGDFMASVSETRFANTLAMQKLTAMWLKAEYLSGKFTGKEIYRQLFVASEEGFDSMQTNASLPAVIQAQLQSLSPQQLILQTHLNVSRVIDALNGKAKSHLLSANSELSMGLVLVLADERQRDSLRKTLIENSIYPAVLWPRQFIDADIHLQERILFVHVDFRYTEEDLTFIISVINNFFHNA